MKKILASIVFGIAVLTAIPAQAREWDYRSGVDHGGRQHSGSYRDVAWQRQYNRNYGRHYNHRRDSNTTEKVVLAALLTGVIVDAAHRSKDKQPNVVYVPTTPPPTTTCTTREVYDYLGRVISTERTCY